MSCSSSLLQDTGYRLLLALHTVQVEIAQFRDGTILLDFRQAVIRHVWAHNDG